MLQQACLLLEFMSINQHSLVPRLHRSGNEAINRCTNEKALFSGLWWKLVRLKGIF